MKEGQILEKKQKKWHQKWWGIIILFIFSIFILYAGFFIYRVVALVEEQNKILASEFNNYNSLFNLSINVRDIVETKDDPFLGNENAQVVIVEFSDFQCPFCKEAYPILKKIRQEYKDSVKIIYRDFPNLISHPDALNAALAANCANEQNKFEIYHDFLFENQANLSIENLKNLAEQIGLDLIKFNQCLDNQKYLAEIQNDLQDGIQFGLEGTPTFFINGNKVAGVIPYVTFKTLIDNLRSFEVQKNSNLDSNSQSMPTCTVCNK